MSTSRPDADFYAGAMSDAGWPLGARSTGTEPQAVQAAPPAIASILGRVGETEVLLSDVERALERLEAGSYSLCEVCGTEIDLARLDASPVTRRCEAHAS